MRLRYRNKRDFYKAEADRLAEQAEMWKKEAEAKQIRLDNLTKPSAPKKGERINVKWFCTQCRVGQEGTVSRGTNIEDCSCLNCGARKLLAVARFPSDF